MLARWSRFAALLTAIVCCSLLPRGVSAQATISGRAVGPDGEPVQQVRVLLVGTALSAVTGQNGRYTIHNVPIGPQTVRALRIGYREQKKAVTIGANATVGMDFALERSIVELEEIVSTATGAQPREELGNAVSTINASKVAENSAVSNLQDLLAARVPGVNVQTGSQTGGGARIRIRGNSSLNLANDPIYVIDGIRMTSNTGSSALFTGGSQPNRANDLNLDEIENIEIVKGPSAATLYGTDAANGVVLITTKRGRAGAPRWQVYGEDGVITDNTKYPYNYTIAGHAPATPTVYRECTLPQLADPTICVKDSVRTYSPLHDKDVSPIGTGYRNQQGMTLGGGTEVVRYFLSGEREEESSVLTLPPSERRRLDSARTTIQSYTSRPNGLFKNSGRANLNMSPTPKLDLSISTGLVSSNTHFVTESNATAGLGSQIFGGKGFKTNGSVSGLEVGTPSTPLLGYRAWTPGYTFQELNQQKVTRVIASGSADWRPLAWMQNRATFGVDYTSRLDFNLNKRGQGPPVNSTYRLGFADDNRTAIRNMTVDLGSSSNWVPYSGAALRSTVGVQYVSFYFDQNDAFGGQLAPGTQTPNSGTIPSATSSTTISKTLGAFIEEQYGINDRLWVTAAMRSDQNSAFGTKFQQAYYPKVSASWIASQEPFFPSMGWLDQFRLRAAYGMSGVQPGSNDALRAFDGVLANYRATDAPAVIYTAVGNADLRPEKTSEFEGGFDIRFLRRANFELTYYSKDTKDALISAIIPPSAGAAQNVRRNLGSVRNAGFETLVSVQALDRPAFGLDFAATYATNANKLVKLGKDAAGNPLPPVIATTWRATPGYPLFGFWERPITGWDDKDNNGILTYNIDPTKNEVFVGANAVFRGPSTPTHTGTFTQSADLFHRALRVSSMFEFKGGNKYYNNTERIRCVSRQNCNGLMNPNASFQEQAMVVATLNDPSKTLDGFFQDGSFTRWRELSATYTLRNTVASRYMHAQRASVNFAARNLHVWTKYRGLDPEIDRLAGSSSNAPPEEFQTLGTPTYFVFRLNLGF